MHSFNFFIYLIIPRNIKFINYLKWYDVKIVYACQGRENDLDKCSCLLTQTEISINRPGDSRLLQKTGEMSDKSR